MQLQMSADLLQEEDEEHEGMLRIENIAEDGDLIPPPGNGLSATQTVAIGCHDAPLVLVKTVAFGVLPGVGRDWSKANETA